MLEQDSYLTTFARSFFLAAMSHGLGLLVGVLVLMAITYTAAFVLISVIKSDQGSRETDIRMPFLRITSSSTPRQQERKLKNRRSPRS